MSQRPPVVGGGSEAPQPRLAVPSNGAPDSSVTPGIAPLTYSLGDRSTFFGAVDNNRFGTPSPCAQLDDAPASETSAAKDEQPQRKASLTDIDPRAAFPSLSLTGSVISAAFCVPYSLEYRKGSDWVSELSRPRVAVD